jgi:hypothetical protein
MITWSPENAEMAKIQNALIRAGQTAREDARRHGVPIVVWKDGQVVLEDPGTEIVSHPVQRSGDTKSS